MGTGTAGKTAVSRFCWDVAVTEGMKGDFLVEFYGKTRILRGFHSSKGMIFRVV